MAQTPSGIPTGDKRLITFLSLIVSPHAQLLRYEVITGTESLMSVRVKQHVPEINRHSWRDCQATLVSLFKPDRKKNKKTQTKPDFVNWPTIT